MGSIGRFSLIAANPLALGVGESEGRLTIGNDPDSQLDDANTHSLRGLAALRAR